MADPFQIDNIAIPANVANLAASYSDIFRLVTSYILGIHTSTPTLALGLLDLESGDASDDRSIQSRNWWLDRQMSSQLHPCLQAFFPPEQWPQLAAVAVAVGPGSFTSCRMGVTVARTLGQSLRIPLFGWSSLAAIAAEYVENKHLQAQATIAVQMDAKREEWFGGIYRKTEAGLVAQVSDRLWSDAEWRETTNGLITLDAKDWETHPPVAALLTLAAKQYGNGQRPSWDKVLPFYGRKPPIHQG